MFIQVRLEGFTVMKIQVSVFWVVTLCNDVVGYQHFRGSTASIFSWYRTTSLYGFTTQKTVT